jgi:hypothetical protein
VSTILLVNGLPSSNKKTSKKFDDSRVSTFTKEERTATNLGWYADFLLEINLKYLLRKTGAGLKLIKLISLYID